MRSSLPSPARAPLSPAGRLRGVAPRRAILAAAAVQLLLQAAPAAALETVWTGAAGPGQAFWDLADNWSNGLPATLSTEVTLGGSDTTLRSGHFSATRLTGRGTLRMTGGQLALASAGSQIGRLELLDGSLLGAPDPSGGPTAATLTVGSFLWSGGRLHNDQYLSNGPRITVLGDAVLSGRVLSTGAYHGALTFEGNTHWVDGASQLGGNAEIRVGRQARFLDDVSQGQHSLSIDRGAFVNEGRYVKRGAGETRVRNEFGSFNNTGTMRIEQGRWYIDSYEGGWTNTGRVDVQSEMVVSGYRNSLRQNGSLHIHDGGRVRMDFGIVGGSATGQWFVAPSATLEFAGSEQYGQGDMDFGGGRLHNEGVVRYRSGNYTVAPEAELSGQGRYEVLGNSRVVVRRGLDVGTLYIGEPRADLDDQTGSLLGYSFSRLQVEGPLSVDRLEWADGALHTGGPVTVRGRAVLTEDPRYWLSPSDRPIGKQLASAFDFQGGVVWDGHSDLHGAGSIRVRAGTTFEDLNSQGTREVPSLGEPFTRPTRISVASFLNEGTYLKKGAGATVITADVDNRGTFRVLKAGTLRLTGRVNNTGTLEADGSRLIVWGRLAQYLENEYGQLLLGGGSYVARHGGTLALNLGDTSSGAAPALITVLKRGTTVVLDGLQSRFVTSWQGEDVDALSRLSYNEGRIAVLNGANLGLAEGLSNGGVLHVGARSTLQAQTYRQDGGEGPDDSATWLDGTIAAKQVTLSGGVYSAGAMDAVGTGHFSTDHAELQATLLLDIDSSELYDRLFVSGQVTLGGSLQVAFGDAGPVLGTFLFLTAEDGLGGSFASISSDLDPTQFRLAARYGNDFVELTVERLAAVTVPQVPEPGTWALLGLGLAALGARRRGRFAC